MLFRLFREADRTVRALVLCTIFSFLVWGLVLLWGLNPGPANLPDHLRHTSYFQTINWWPYPFFFLLLIPVTHLTWRAFLVAWGDLARTSVLVKDDGQPAGPEHVKQLIAGVTDLRIWAVYAAIAMSLLVNIIDARHHFPFFMGLSPLSDQIAYACARPTSWTKWVFEAFAENTNICANMPNATAGITAPLHVLFFALISLIQQLLIVFFVALVMAQLLLHTIVFGAFERLLPDLHEQGVTLRLNPTSPMREFGLERWNYALNDFYWMSCPVLLLVFLSRNSVDEALYDPGQEMLGFVVPALLLAPMVCTIFARQIRLPEVWNRLQDAADDSADRHFQQQLWPLDRNWSAKLGIILAFALAAISLGAEARKLLGVAV